MVDGIPAVQYLHVTNDPPHVRILRGVHNPALHETEYTHTPPNNVVLLSYFHPKQFEGERGREGMKK